MFAVSMAVNGARAELWKVRWCREAEEGGCTMLWQERTTNHRRR